MIVSIRKICSFDQNHEAKSRPVISLISGSHLFIWFLVYYEELGAGCWLVLLLVLVEEKKYQYS